MKYTDASWPKAYAVFFSGQPQGKEYAEGITLMAYMDFSEVKQWVQTQNTVSSPTERGDGYEDFKKSKLKSS